MEELLNLARQLRPTALDDHGLMPAVETQLKRFSARTGVEVSLNTEATRTRSPRTCRRPSTGSSRRRSRTSAATRAPPPWPSNSRPRASGSSCACATTARASTPRRSRGASNGDGPGAGLGLSGMAERARLAGGELDVRSAPGGGTTVTLRIAELATVAT